MRKKYVILAAMVVGLSNAQTQRVPLAQGSLTNRDVVALAGAGFNEEFIIDTIQNSRTQFDTTVDGLVDLAKHGLSERLIRAMMSPAAPMAVAVSSSASAAGAPEIEMPTPYGPAAAKGGTKAVRPTPADAAVASGTPYYEWRSYLFGLWKKQVGVGPLPQQRQAPASHLGEFYEQVRMPAAQTSHSAPQVVYFRVAP